MKIKFVSALAAALIAVSSVSGTVFAYDESVTPDSETENEAVFGETEREIPSADGGAFSADEQGNIIYVFNGKKARGLKKIDGKIYYFGEKGIMAFDKKLRISGNMYFFSSDGSAYTGRQIIDGKEYTFSENGVYLGKHIDTDFVDSSDMYTYDELKEDIKALKDHYPDLFDCKIIGKTADKRYIYDITIGDPNADKQIVFIAGIHAREHMTCLLVMDQAEYLLNSYYVKGRNDSSYRSILSEYTIHIIPMANPDGITISQFGADGLNNETLRKNARTMYKNAKTWGYTSLSEEDYYKRWKANARGVDLNRNFDAKWDIIETLNGRVGENYKGPEPMSELETKYIARFIKSLSNPLTIVSYHATGSMIYWDYGQEGKLRERCEKQIEILKNLTDYTILDYSKYSSGGLSDYIFAEGMFVVPNTIEIGTTPAPVDMSEYDDVYKRNISVPISLAELYLNIENEENDLSGSDSLSEVDDSESYDLYYPSDI